MGFGCVANVVSGQETMDAIDTIPVVTQAVTMKSVKTVRPGLKYESNEFRRKRF